MGFAEAVDCPVLLIGDINRGGVFAHLTGTVNLLSESEQSALSAILAQMAAEGFTTGESLCLAAWDADFPIP